jgi:hypothetical protein
VAIAVLRRHPWATTVRLSTKLIRLSVTTEEINAVATIFHGTGADIPIMTGILCAMKRLALTGIGVDPNCIPFDLNVCAAFVYPLM